MSTEYHARLSPSSAARWINCPASVELSKGLPDTAGTDAEKGRLAHAIAELKARRQFLALNKRTYTSHLKKLQENPLYETAMDNATDSYIEELTEHAMAFKEPPFIALETEVPIGLITGEKKALVTGLPEDTDKPATGTADCIQIGESVLWITDYKNGTGVLVEAEENPQMKLYALAALAYYRPFYGDTLRTVRMTIVQPHAGGARTWETTREELEAWGRDVAAPAAAKALGGDDEPRGGEWCKSHFCPLRQTCRARAQEMFAVDDAFGRRLPPLLTDAEVGDALTRGAALVSWYNDLKDYALQACLDGKDIPGYKAVAGRSAREWDDLDAAFAQLQQRGVAGALLWERKPVTPPALEKALGKKPFAEAADGLVVQSPGKPTLVPSSDKRPPYNQAEAAFGEEEKA